MKKEELIKLLKEGVEIFATSYESEKDIEKALSINENQIEYLKQYDGDDFTYNDLEFVDGDSIYKISKWWILNAKITPPRNEMGIFV